MATPLTLVRPLQSCKASAVSVLPRCGWHDDRGDGARAHAGMGAGGMISSRGWMHLVDLLHTTQRTMLREIEVYTLVGAPLR